MHRKDKSARLVIPTHTELYRQLETLATTSQMVFFAGLPGTGKSLLIHQLAHLAAATGRNVHLLQWDMVRPVFEAHPAGQRYPLRDGVTHGVIRKAVGLWVRQALGCWHPTPAGFDHLLIGETPFIGNRFIELARIQDDAAEGLLRRAATVFVIPVPSPEVRRFIETERARRSANPSHTQESEDAPPPVLQALWQELVRTAPRLGVRMIRESAPTAYHPLLYQKVYEALLRHRHTQVLAIDTRFPTTALSVYDFGSEFAFLTPTADDVAACIETVNRQYADPQALERDVAQWHLV